MLPYKYRLVDIEIDSVCSALRTNRQVVQKKIFTHFINTQLKKIDAKLINDLYADFSEGECLAKFIEVTLNTEVEFEENASHRLVKLENVSHCLDVLVAENIIRENEYYASDIVDQSRLMILSLAWKIIMRCYFPHSVHPGQTADDLESQLLISWCRSRLVGFPSIAVLDFDYSWHDGRAFAALIHSVKPELIKMNSVDLEQVLEILADKFHLAPLFLTDQLVTGSVDQRLMIGFIESIRAKILRMEFNGDKTGTENFKPETPKPSPTPKILKTPETPKTTETPKTSKPTEKEQEPRKKTENFPEKSPKEIEKSLIKTVGGAIVDFIKNPVVQTSAIFFIVAVLLVVFFRMFGNDLLTYLCCLFN